MFVTGAAAPDGLRVAVIVNVTVAPLGTTKMRLIGPLPVVVPPQFVRLLPLLEAQLQLNEIPAGTGSESPTPVAASAPPMFDTATVKRRAVPTVLKALLSED